MIDYPKRVPLPYTVCDFYISRSASPHHGFTIMNRLSTENLVEPINRDLEFQLQDPFLLYRKGNCEYYVDVCCAEGRIYIRSMFIIDN